MYCFARSPLLSVIVQVTPQLLKSDKVLRGLASSLYSHIEPLVAPFAVLGAACSTAATSRVAAAKRPAPRFGVAAALGASFARSNSGMCARRFTQAASCRNWPRGSSLCPALDVAAATTAKALGALGNVAASAKVPPMWGATAALAPCPSTSAICAADTSVPAPSPPTWAATGAPASCAAPSAICAADCASSRRAPAPPTWGTRGAPTPCAWPSATSAAECAASR
mmetsp:Transcript_43110/g.125485  ORF Transcript_43110/g.125485 Transcript_43110/m.125485 type:complete len:225 (+) Transcript_43110:284-958(+)